MYDLNGMNPFGVEGAAAELYSRKEVPCVILNHSVSVFYPFCILYLSLHLFVACQYVAR